LIDFPDDNVSVEVGAGGHRYRVVTDWVQLPEGRTRPFMAIIRRSHLKLGNGRQRSFTHVLGGLSYLLLFDAPPQYAVIFFDWVQKWMADLPVISPTPKRESFQPPKPNGSRGTGTPTLMPIIPALAR
jgi:hypothetical protein